MPQFVERRGIRIGFIAVSVVVLVALVELCSFGAGRVLQSRFKMYSAPVMQPAAAVKTYGEYLALRDQRLGWPSTAPDTTGAYDAAGARPSPAFPDPRAAADRVTVFGDSYAAGSEVDDTAAWGNQLALLAGSRVGNFGVPGYGTDQAYMRYLARAADPAPVVILTHLSEGIMRNLTRNWDLITHASHYAMKPRFVLDDRGALLEVPLMAVSESEYRRSVGLESPFLPIPDENFQPGGAAGVTGLAFPYSVAVLRNMAGYQMRSLFARRPDFAEFYQRGHPLRGLEISTAILQAFQETARGRGQVPLVVLFATRHDLAHQRKTGAFPYQNLVDDLNRLQVDHLDFGPILARHIGDKGVPGFFKPLGHYNEEVNKLLADAVYDVLLARGGLTR